MSPKMKIDFTYKLSTDPSYLISRHSWDWIKLRAHHSAAYKTTTHQCLVYGMNCVLNLGGLTCTHTAFDSTFSHIAHVILTAASLVLQPKKIFNSFTHQQSNRTLDFSRAKRIPARWGTARRTVHFVQEHNRCPLWRQTKEFWIGGSVLSS